MLETILLCLFVGSALIGVLVNSYWVLTRQDGYNNKLVAPFNGVILSVFFLSMLLLGLGFGAGLIL